MAINYRNCPLKKRPVHLIDDSSDEPENLSTKPEDLSLTGRYASKSPESSPQSSPHSSPQSSPSSSPPLSLPPSTNSPSLSPSASTPTTSPSPPHYMYPMKHELVYPTPISPEYAPQTWHRSIAPVYAPYPAYLPYAAYPHHDYMNMNGSTSTYSDRSISPPLHHHHHQPLAPLALRPTMYSSIDQASLSPNSSTSISPPPNAAQDLSEKRRQGVRHQCQDCGKSYSTFSGLSKHRQFHCAAGDAPRKSFSCKHCDKVYVSLGALKMHIRTHTLPCKCTICGKAFSRPWLLQGHIRTHTGEKPFSCQHCNRAFADRSNLRAHLQTHSDVKKYSCQCCSKTFSRMSLLTKHTEGGCNGSAFMQIKAEKVY